MSGQKRDPKNKRESEQSTVLLFWCVCFSYRSVGNPVAFSLSPGCRYLSWEFVCGVLTFDVTLCDLKHMMLKANSLKTLFALHITHAHTVEICTHALSLPLTYIKTITKVHRTSITNIPTVFSIPASNAHNVGLKGFSTPLTPGQIKPRRGRWRGEDGRMNDLKKEGRVYWLH